MFLFGVEDASSADAGIHQRRAPDIHMAVGVHRLFHGVDHGPGNPVRGIRFRAHLHGDLVRRNEAYAYDTAQRIRVLLHNSRRSGTERLSDPHDGPIRHAIRSQEPREHVHILMLHERGDDAFKLLFTDAGHGQQELGVVFQDVQRFLAERRVDLLGHCLPDPFEDTG